jgi:hypothetical protein
MGRCLSISQVLDVDELPIFVVVQVASFVVSRFTSALAWIKNFAGGFNRFAGDSVLSRNQPFCDHRLCDFFSIC